MTNEELNNRLKALYNGDTEAFEEIYNNLKTPVYTVIYRMVQDRHTAEDILQEFFIRLYKSPPEKQLDNPRAYLLKIAHNLTVDVLRRYTENGNIDDYEGLAAVSDGTDVRLELNEAMKKLTFDERQAVVLHVNGGLKFREIAEMTGIPSGTVIWRYHKAIKKLREMLS